jgi:hypothetical protein
MSGGLYRVLQPVTIAGVEHQPGALLRLSATTATTAGAALQHHSVAAPSVPSVSVPDEPVTADDGSAEE